MSKNKELNIKLLQLASFEGEELEKFLPDWMEATETVGLSDDDVKYAIDYWIPAHWDIQYKGVRMMIGAFFRELVDLSNSRKMKAAGKPVIYGIIPAVPMPYYALKEECPDSYMGFPDLLLVNIINGFFHNAAPLLNYAEEIGFSYGCRHCPLNKMRVSAFAKGIIGAPDVIWSWGMNCDEGPKTDEFIQCLIGEDWNSVVSRIPHDTNFGNKDDDVESRVTYLANVFKHSLDEIEKKTGVALTDEGLKKAQKKIMNYGFKYGSLVSLACKADPPVLGGATLTNFAMPHALCFNNGYTYFEPAIDVLMKELREAIKEGNGILPKGSPKVGSYFIPFAVPWVDRIFRENGVSTSFSLTMTPSKKQLTPGKYTDKYMALAEDWLKFPMGQNMGYEVESMIEKVKVNKPDGMLMGFFDFDRWLGAHQKMASTLVEKETGVPHFYMESDFWDDREYSEEALRTRIESIAQLLCMKKEMNE